MAQLVGEHVTLVNTMSDTVLDPAGVGRSSACRRSASSTTWPDGRQRRQHPRRAQVRPQDRGQVDQTYGDLDGVMANADQVKGKIGENLRASLEQLPLSRELTTIKTDVELDFGPKDLTPAEPDVETLRDWYERIESKRLLATVRQRRGEPMPRRRPRPRHRGTMRLVLRPRPSWMPGSRSSAAPSCSPSTPRPPTSTTCARASSGCPSRVEMAQGGRLCARRPQLSGRAGSARPRQGARQLKPLLEDPNRPRSARTSSTT
jgi:DNA polymerase-1